MLEGNLGTKLTVVAAQIGGASGVRAFDGISDMVISPVVGASMVVAERFAASLLLALAVVALPSVGIIGRSVAIVADD